MRVGHIQMCAVLFRFGRIRGRRLHGQQRHPGRVLHPQHIYAHYEDYSEANDHQKVHHVYLVYTTKRLGNQKVK